MSDNDDAFKKMVEMMGGIEEARKRLAGMAEMEASKGHAKETGSAPNATTPEVLREYDIAFLVAAPLSFGTSDQPLPRLRHDLERDAIARCALLSAYERIRMLVCNATKSTLHQVLAKGAKILHITGHGQPPGMQPREAMLLLERREFAGRSDAVGKSGITELVHRAK